MSERGLIFVEEGMSHRMLVIYEAAGMAGDMQTYLVRSLLSEGCIRYQMAAKGPGGEIVGRLVELEGPTGLIVTTTAISLHPENKNPADLRHCYGHTRADPCRTPRDCRRTTEAAGP